MVKKLNELLALLDIKCDDERLIVGISDDSRLLKPNELFLCFDLTYLPKDSLSLGCFKQCDYYYANMEKARLILLKHFYNCACDKLKIIAITGTAGKSSVCYMLYHILSRYYRCMFLGTHLIKTIHGDYPCANTTLGITSLAKLVHEANKDNYDFIMMEVSSHAIAQKRIALLKFDIIAYTNILSDHLDYHLTLDAYIACKLSLVNYLKANGLIYSYQNRFYNNLLPPHLEIKQALNCECSLQGSRFIYRDIIFNLGLVGDFQVDNALLAIEVASNYLSLQQIKGSLNSLNKIKGRLELVLNTNYQAYVDYAHTSDELERILLFFNQYKQGRIIIVVGCGGNRDQSKRKVMGRIASRLSDICIFTSDNPRYESIDLIIKQMKQDVGENVKIIKNRALAIKYAIKIAMNSDIILVVGKGDEHIQEINGIHYFFHDATYLKHWQQFKEDL